MELCVSNGKLPGGGKYHKLTLIKTYIRILGLKTQVHTLSPMATPPRYATIEDMCRLLVKIVIYTHRDTNVRCRRL